MHMKTAQEYPHRLAMPDTQQAKPDQYHETSFDLDLYIDFCLMDIRMQPYGNAGQGAQRESCENRDGNHDVHAREQVR